MGLLSKRKQRPQSAIISKNPTGLPTNHAPVPSGPPASSLIAAKAAALTFSSNANSGAASKPVPSSNKPKQVNLMGRNSQTQSPTRRSSLYIPLKRDPSISNINSENLSDNDTSIKHDNRPPLTRGRSSMRNSISNITSLQAANAAAIAANARSISSELLVPPVPIRQSREYSTSRSGSVVSSVPSAHSFDSMPLYAKLRQIQSSTADDTTSGNQSSDLADEEEEEEDEVDDDDASGFKITFDDFGYYDPPDSADLSSINSWDERQLTPVKEVESPIFEDDRHYWEQSSDADVAETAGLSYDHTKKTLVPTDPLVVGELPKTKPLRKPPPTSPIADYNSEAPDTSFSSSPTRDKRASSPRRKPPQDFSDYNDSQISFNVSDVKAEEAFPQYPLTNEELKRSKHINKKQHHRLSSHALKKGAKKILKKGFKVNDLTNQPSNSSESDLSAKPKPVQLKTTMRKEKKTKFNEDKPWKHHYDREFITEQERKRYEGVWVTNKGLYMDQIDSSGIKEELDNSHSMNAALKASMLSTNNEVQVLEWNLMLNLVVKEIWTRSQLPKHLLHDIWELVDTRKDGTLDKKSFIVGMWLVDQCLYGRKLPRVVEENVWNSVSHLGVNVVIKTKRKK